MTFQEKILQGIPNSLPAKNVYAKNINRAPRRKDILSTNEKELAIRNALRYFPKDWHQELAVEFSKN